MSMNNPLDGNGLQRFWLALKTKLAGKADLVNGKVPNEQLPSYLDEVIESYIVGSTPYASDWLSDENLGTSLTPDENKIYYIVSEGEYQYQHYRWDGTKYVFYGTEDSVPYVFRKSGTTSANREYNSIVGGTVAWNQLADYSKNSTVNHGVTYTNNSDGTWTASKTGEIDAPSSCTVCSTINFIAGHKYFLRGCPNVNGENIRLYITTTGNSDFGNGKIFIFDTDYSGVVKIRIAAGATFDTLVFTPQLFDITLMFGTTIADYIYNIEQNRAGAGVAFFRKLFPKQYYGYNAGELLSVTGLASHDMTGLNQWDEVWELGSISSTTGQSYAATNRIRSKNYNRCIPNKTYYFYGPSYTGTNRIAFYDANKNYLGQPNGSWKSLVNGYTFTTPDNAHYFRFFVDGSTYGNDICISLYLDGEHAGEYEPYTLHSYPLDDSLTLNGIPMLDDNNALYYNGDTYVPDGTVKHRTVKTILNGTESWSISTNSSVPQKYFIHGVGDYGSIVGGAIISNVYERVVVTSSTTAIGINIANSNASNKAVIGIRPSNVDSMTVADFKALLAANPITVVYLLADGYETTETAEPYQTPQSVNAFGTEKYIDYAYSQGTRDVSVPVGHVTKYPVNLPNSSDKLECLPAPAEFDDIYAISQNKGHMSLVSLFNSIKSWIAPKKAGVYVVKGTQTETTASWTGNIDLDALYDGLTIAYYLPTTSASNVTLNLTLSDGTTTGAVAVYYSGTTRMTTHYAAGSTIYLTYWSAGSISVNGTPTTNNRWTHSDYNADNNAYQMYLNTAIKAKTAVTASFLVCGDSDGYSNVAKGVSFDIAYPILHSSNAIEANATRTDLYLTRYFDFTTTNGGTSPGFTYYKAVWLKGKLVGSVFTIDSTTMWTQTIPSTEDGFQYYYIGYAYNSAGLRMTLDHPIFEYSGGSWHPYTRIDPAGSTSIPVYIDTDGKPKTCSLTQYLNAGVGFYTEGVAVDTTIYVSTDIVVTSSSNRWINGRIEGSKGNSTAPLIVYFMMYWNKTGISAFRYYDPLSGINNFSAHVGNDNKVYFSFKQATRFSAIRMFVYENSRNTGNINYVTSISVTAPENITFIHTYDGIRHYSELKDSGVSAGSYGPSANATPAFGSTFNVPYVTVDAKGRLTAASTKTVKIPNAPTIPSASTSNPVMDGTASPGSSSDWARGDHVHPSDTTKLSLTGGTMTGDLTVPTISHVISSLTRGSSYIHTPEGGSYFVASENTGYLKITLPVGPGSTGNRTMVQFTVNIYNHKENNIDNKYYISGYNYITGWQLPTAYSIGNYNNYSNLDVKFGNDGTKAAIWIGAADTKWSYPIVQITDVMVAFENFGIDTWSSGWSITIDSTTPASISTTITNPHVGNGLPISAITNLQTTLDGKSDIMQGVWYGVCSTSNSTQEKAVTITGITELVAGLSIRVKFTNNQSYNGQPTLNLNSLGAKNIVRYGTTAAVIYEWFAGEVVDFVYDGTNWIAVDDGVASTSYYGVTKLSDSVASTSTSVAATANAVKKAYDLADSKFNATGGVLHGGITIDPDDSTYPNLLFKSDADSSGNFGQSLIRKYATNSADYGTLIYDFRIGDGNSSRTEYSYLVLRRNIALANQLRLVYAYKDENDTMQTTAYTIYGTHNKPSPADVGLNRTNAVDVANTNYTTLMARGESLNSTATTPAVNGAIAWQYE